MMVAELRKPDRRSHGELVSIERHIARTEESAAWSRVHQLGRRIHLAVVAQREDVAEQSAGELVVLASRRLRQIGGNDAA